MGERNPAFLPVSLEIEIPSIEENQLISPFPQEKCVTPNNRTMDCKEKLKQFSSLLRNPLILSHKWFLREEQHHWMIERKI